jgi:hypothetical protein
MPKPFSVGPLRVAALLAMCFATTAIAQQPNAPEAGLYLDGTLPSGPVLRPRGAALRFAVRGAPGAPIVLGFGPAATPPVPLLGGTLEVAPTGFALNALDPAHPHAATSYCSNPGGERVRTTFFDPPPGATEVVYQALVGDLTNAPFGFRFTAAITVQLAPEPAAPPPPAVTRGPYLEQTGPTSTLVTVRLDQAASIAVDLGPDGTIWPTTVNSPGVYAEHTVTVNGLSPATPYRYRVRSGGAILCEGPGFSFKTAPPVGSQAPFRFVAWGDAGTGTSTQIRLSQRLEELEPRPDFALILGDIIYPAGEAALYDANFFLPYRAMLASMPIWPAYGNHDAATSAGAAYFANFHLPASGPGGEKYYSFDYGDAHFVCLDTQSSLSATNAMLGWLSADLAATTRTWKIAYFHHPPYTGGTHADNLNVQALIVPLLDAGGVDLVLSGHSHVLERSYLLANHAVVQNDPHDYAKTATPTGAVYAVAGAGGQVGGLVNQPGGAAQHPLMAFQLGGTLGHLVVEVEGPNLRGYFLDDAGQHRDRFSITKGADATPPVALTARAGSSPRDVVVVFDEPVLAGAGPGGAENPANYLLDGTTPAVSVALDDDSRSATVAFPSVPFGVAHTVTVSGVFDRAVPPNVLPSMTLAVPDAPWRKVVQPYGHWHVFEGFVAPPANWAEAGFDDAAWLETWAPVGYGSALFPPGGAGHVLTAMSGAYATFFARAEFLLEDPSAVEGLRFEANFDDGLVAYLNGFEIARRGVPVGQNETTLASNHPAGDWERFLLPQAVRFLRPGVNVLAIELHNTTLTSSDAFLDAALSLRGPGFAPGLRLSLNGVTGPDHYAVALPRAGFPLDAVVEGGAARAGAPLHLFVGFELRDALSLGDVVVGGAPFVSGVASAGGDLAFGFGLAPAALIGIPFVLQAHAADGSSSALVAMVVP